MIVDTPDSLLVADINKSQDIKKIVKKLEAKKKTEINEINGILHLMGQKQNVKTTLNLEYLKKINALINS